MWRIDYHIHTVFSDGASRPADIVRIAAAKGMKSIAITDHDGIDGVSEAINEGAQMGVKVGTGIELATEYSNGDGLHILGYGFNPKDKGLQDMLEYMAEERDKRNHKLIKAIRELGCDITLEEILAMRSNNFISKPTMARLMVTKGYINNWLDAFEPGKYFEDPEIKSLKKNEVDSIEAVKTVAKAGGIPVLAHPIQAKQEGEPVDDAFFAKIDCVIGELTKAGLHGIECYHPDQDREQSVKFIDIAEKYGLKLSRGTDFHDGDYNITKTTADYIQEGNANGYGSKMEDFIEI